MTPKQERDRPRKLLVVDDHAISGQYAVEALSRCSCKVLWVQTAFTAVETALCWHPDIIFCDRHLPDMDGLELLDRIRAEWPTDRTLPKLIVMTADESSLDGAATEALVVDYLLVKPVSGREIRAAAGLTDRTDVEEPAAVGARAGLQIMFREELAQRLPELDLSVSGLDGLAAAAILHQLIASAAMCRESRLESGLRSLDQACRRETSPADMARRYHLMLECAREFISRTDPR